MWVCATSLNPQMQTPGGIKQTNKQTSKANKQQQWQAWAAAEPRRESLLPAAVEKVLTQNANKQPNKKANNQTNSQTNKQTTKQTNN